MSYKSSAEERIHLKLLLSKVLLELRLKHGYDSHDVAKYLGIQYHSYWRYETQRKTGNLMTVDVLYKINRLYNVDVLDVCMKYQEEYEKSAAVLPGTDMHRELDERKQAIFS